MSAGIRKGYPITYRIDRHDPPMPKEEVKAQGLVGCDNLVLVSIIGTPGDNHPLSTATVTAAGTGPLQPDGSWPELEPVQRWQVWVMMADGLAEQLGDDPRATICRFVIETTRSVVLGAGGHVPAARLERAHQLLGEVAQLLLGK